MIPTKEVERMCLVDIMKAHLPRTVTMQREQCWMRSSSAIREPKAFEAEEPELRHRLGG
jgi:hypothetical protein